jgi:predicted transcriptional regulator/very-short-patch-repair endonuclease
MLLDSRKEEVLSLVDQGLSMERIAKAINVSFTAVRNFLVKNNLQTKAKYSDVESLKDTVLKLYEEGKTINAISRSTGICQPTVSKILKDKPRIDVHVQTVQSLGLGFKVVNRIDGRFCEYECPDGHRFIRATNNFMAFKTCPECAPRSAGEDLFAEKLKDIAEFKRNTKIPDSNLELDFITGSVGIEYCGEFWHSTKYKDKRYHLNKLELCLENGISLLQFWEHEILEKEEIVLSMIRSKLNKPKHKVYARTTKARVLSKKEASEFFNKNHLQGSTPNLVCFGLTDSQGSIIAALSLRMHGAELEIARFATVLNTQVLGGFQKLLKQAKLWAIKMDHSKIVTFANRRYSYGKVYQRAGFKLLGPTSLDFFWLKNGRRLNRRASWGKVKEFTAQKGYYKVYGTGNLKFEIEV